LASRGKTAITRHVDKVKDKKNATVIAENQLLSLFIKPKRSSDTEQIGGAEGVLGYYIAVYRHLFGYAHCASNDGLFRSTFSLAKVQ
jgi:hypothetical protein